MAINENLYTAYHDESDLEVELIEVNELMIPQMEAEVCKTGIAEVNGVREEKADAGIRSIVEESLYREEAREQCGYDDIGGEKVESRGDFCDAHNFISVALEEQWIAFKRGANRSGKWII